MVKERDTFPKNISNFFEIKKKKAITKLLFFDLFLSYSNKKKKKRWIFDKFLFHSHFHQPFENEINKVFDLYSL